jgi:hypothetical protein
MCRLLSALFLFVAVAAGTATAQSSATHGDSLPPIRALRLASPVSIDGALADAAWQGPPSSTRLVQGEPIEGAAPSESTWVWIAFDEDALYVAARCWDSSPDSIIANLVRRDGYVASDRFLVLLDPYHDHRSGYFFCVNAAGVLRDGTLFNDAWSDDSWDGVWEGRARRDDKGWTCELRIPFSQMRYRAGAEQIWGVNLRRRIERRSEELYTVYRPKTESGYVSRFAHLVGLENGHRSRSIEVRPYATGKGEYLVHDAGDPFRNGGRYTPGIGADLRTSVGNNLTLNATVNPDFGQVEVDPAVVNLSDVETFFQEKRPFFTENSRVFNFGTEGAEDYWGFNWWNPDMFYSRRIGRCPQGGVPDEADYCDVPMATHILGAAKLTGKLTPSVNFGTLHALTSKENADYSMGDVRAKTQVEPLTYYGVMRGLKEFKDAYNGLGAMATLAQRRFDGGGLVSSLNRQSLMAGLDGWHFLDREKMWVVSGWAGMTRVAGSPERMVALQRSSRHYFQRPTAGYVDVDSSATSLTGYGARMWLNKQKGNIFSNVALGFLSPRFDVNDIGFEPYSDIINGHAGIGYKWTEPKAWRKRGHVIAAYYETRDFGNNRINQGIWSCVRNTFMNDYYAEFYLSHRPETMNNRATRGGPLMRNLANWSTSAWLSSPDRNKFVYSGGFDYGGSPDGRRRYFYVYPRVEWKPASNLSFRVGPNFDHVIEDAQYVTQVDDPGNVAADFGDRRFVFGRMDQRTVSASIRLNVSFTPTLSLETYIQPLISAGRYTGFKELAQARSYEFVRYGEDNGSTYDAATGMVDPDGPSGPAPPFELSDPSFNFKSLRGNAVLRWEYRPGSTLFLVWTQSRTDSEELGDLRFGPSSRRLLDAQADNIFLAKVTYYLNL